ncbi:hypothetical protein GmHk_04G010981 [Glycine max]|nr:hypothetical protein GmHk_04G010981 [Glycine max]
MLSMWNVDHVADAVHEQPREAVINDVHAEAQGFASGPPRYISFDGICSSCGSHSLEHPKLKLSSHERKVQKFERSTPKIEGIVVTTRLSPLIACSLDIGDRGLIFAFGERRLHTFDAFHVDQDVDLLVEFLEVNSQECWIYKHFPTIVSCIVNEDYHERKPCVCCWKSGKALSVSTYRKRLDKLTSKVVCRIPYGYHRTFREFELISLFFGQIRWGPSIVIHQPERVMQQFGYVQTIPPHPVVLSLSIKEIDDK